MNKSKKAILFLLPVLLFGLAAAQEKLDVETVIRIGLENNFNIRIAKNTAEIAENNRTRGTAGFMPTLDATGNFSKTVSDQTTNSPFSFGTSKIDQINGSLTLNWTLFDGFRMFADNARYSDLAELNKQRSRQTIENSVVALLRAYFNLVQQQQLLAVAEERRDISAERFEKEKLRRELGGTSAVDMLNAEVSLNNDEAALLQQRLALIAARKQLNLLMARDPQTPLEVKTDIIIPPLDGDFELLWQTAEQKNSGLLAAMADRSVAGENVTVLRSSWYPRLGLNASYSWSDRTTDSDSPRFEDIIKTRSTDKSVALNLSFNLFNGWRNRVDVQNARLEERNKLLAMEDARNRVRGDLYEKTETFRQQLRLLELQQKNELAASKNLEVISERHRLGAVTSLEFRDAQINLANAQTAVITARFQARITRLDIEQLTGDLKITVSK